MIPAGARKMGTQPPHGARDTYGSLLFPSRLRSLDAHCFRARRRDPRPPHRPRLRGDGQRQRLLPRCARALDRRRVHRRAARGRRCRRRRRLPPRRRRPCGGHRHLRRRLHEHAHGAGRSGAGACAARARGRRRAHLRSAALGRRSDRPRVGGRRAHVHRGASGCRGHDRHRDRARPDLSGADRARDPLRRRVPRRRPGARGARAAAARAGRPARPVRGAGDPRRRGRPRRGEAPVPARRARRVDRRRGRGARRPRRRDRRADRVDGARPRRLPPPRVRPRA